MAALIGVVLILACRNDRNGSSEIWFTRVLPNGSQLIAFDPSRATSRVVIPTHPGKLEIVAFSPAGTNLAYIVADEFGRTIWISKGDGSNFRPITPVAKSALYVWLNDSELLVATSNQPYTRADEGDWFLYDVKSNSKQELLNQGHVTLLCIGGSNGKPIDLQFDRLSFLGDHDSLEYGQLSAQEGRVQKTTPTRVDLSQFPNTNGALCNFAMFEKNQVAFIWYSSENNAEIGTATATSAQVTRLTNFAKQYEESFIHTMAVSPDQHWLVFAASLASPKQPGLPSGDIIGRINLQDGEIEVLHNQELGYGGFFTWSPDSRYVAIELPLPGSNPITNEIYSIDMNTKKVELIMDDKSLKRLVAWR